MTQIDITIQMALQCLCSISVQFNSVQLYAHFESLHHFRSIDRHQEAARKFNIPINIPNGISPPAHSIYAQLWFWQ